TSGLQPVLRRVLDTFLGEELHPRIDIVANDAEIKPDGSQWKPIRRNDTELGHDKAASMVDAREQAELASDDGTIPLIVFIGDSVSDLPRANQADVLFTRHGLRLEEYCRENDIAYIPFDTFADIQAKLQEIAEEDRRETGGRGAPKRFNPREWRRVSSRRFMSSLRRERRGCFCGQCFPAQDACCWADD
ncbi:hypothetical protein GE09DRAFT_951854, partial [Coniochaeta sp. 2T2.1]